jgi:hypothetical protein
VGQAKAYIAGYYGFWQSEWFHPRLNQQWRVFGVLHFSPKHCADEKKRICKAGKQVKYKDLNVIELPGEIVDYDRYCTQDGAAKWRCGTQQVLREFYRSLRE